MKVKRYVGETAQQAIQKVKSDLGRDAIILNTRKIRKKGIVGMFSKPLIEVVATIDNDVVSSRKPVHESKITQIQTNSDNNAYDGNSFRNELAQNITKQNSSSQVSNTQHQKNIYTQSNLEAYKKQNADNGQEMQVQMKKYQEQIQKAKEEINDLINLNQVQKETDNNYEDNNDEISEIKDMLNKVYDAVKTDYESSMLSEISLNYLKKLEDNEVDKTIINDIKEDIMELLSIEKQENENNVKNAIFGILSKYFKDPEPFIPSKSKKVILFIGPTGVGKTTTLAKLAANLVINEKRKVGLITSDTYRIAAVEQLKTYSEIIGVPLSIIYSPTEIANTINNYKDRDIVLVDTAGRSHKDQYQLMELKSLLKYSIDFEVHLLISATTKFSDCLEIIKSYSFLDSYKLLFTKLDETSTLGVLLNVAYITKKPISYLTIGQSVPDDIEVADKNKIINSLLGENLYERSS